jgi:hypothetical protein
MLRAIRSPEKGLEYSERVVCEAKKAVRAVVGEFELKNINAKGVG